MATKTITVYPSEYDTVDYAYASATDLTNPIGQSSSNTTYANISLTTGSGAETYIYYKFDLSSIPDNAEIISITCSAKGYISSTSAIYIYIRQMQLFNGTISKGSAVSLTNAATAQTIDVGTWTREELNDCKLRLYAQRTTYGTSTERTMRFYGAELTIEYDAPELVPIVGTVNVDGVAKTISGGYCNIDGVLKPIVKSYANINGVWLPTYRYEKTPTYTWKKYNTVETMHDGWDWSTNYEYVSHKSTSSQVLAYLGTIPSSAYMATYSNGALTSLSTNLQSYTLTAQQLCDDRNLVDGTCNYDAVVKFLNPNSDWAKSDLIPSADLMYKIRACGRNTNGVAVNFTVYSPVYKSTTTYSQGTYIEDVSSIREAEYPTNGRHTDGYWYVKQ